MSNHLFLVTSTITKQGYMQSAREVSQEVDLVEAEDSAAAAVKVCSHYESRSSDYGTSYTCEVVSSKGVVR